MGIPGLNSGREATPFTDFPALENGFVVLDGPCFITKMLKSGNENASLSLLDPEGLKRNVALEVHGKIYHFKMKYKVKAVIVIFD